MPWFHGFEVNNIVVNEAQLVLYLKEFIIQIIKMGNYLSQSHALSIQEQIIDELRAEIRQLNQRVSHLERENERLRQENESLRQELEHERANRQQMIDEAVAIAIAREREAMQAERDAMQQERQARYERALAEALRAINMRNGVMCCSRQFKAALRC